MGPSPEAKPARDAGAGRTRPAAHELPASLERALEVWGGHPAPSSPAPAVARLFQGRGWIATRVASDALMLVLAVAAALLGASAAHIGAQDRGFIWVFPILVMALLALRGMYRPKITMRILDEAGHVVGATSVAAMLTIAAAALADGAVQHASLAARAWLFAIVYVGGARLVLSKTQRRLRIHELVGKRTLIVGAGRIGAQVERRLEGQPELGLRPVGFVDAHPPAAGDVGRRRPVLGGPDELASIVRQTGAEHVILAFLSSRGSDARMVPLVRECDALGVEVSLVPRLFESINVRVGLEHIGGMPLFRLRAVRPRGWEFTVKHALDFLTAASLILVLTPVLVATALAVKLTSRGPVFFRQRRVGRDGHAFDLLKFRSMRMRPPVGEDVTALLLPPDTAPGGVEGADRRTAVGRLIRRTSIDELPQLFNVLKGDMSIVGPRPERPEFVELFESRVDRYDDRHRVKSGITGWAQVHGLRGKTSLSERIELDNYYIENWSLWLDLKVLLMTVTALFHSAE